MLFVPCMIFVLKKDSSVFSRDLMPVLDKIQRKRERERKWKGEAKWREERVVDLKRGQAAIHHRNLDTMINLLELWILELIRNQQKKGSKKCFKTK